MNRFLFVTACVLGASSCAVGAGRPGGPYGTPWPRTAERPAQAVQAAAPAQERTLEVTATAELEVPPDMAHVRLAVETYAPSADSAGRQNARETERVIGALRETGTPDDRIETSGYTVYPEYRYDREVERAEARIIGYRAVNQVTATTRDLDSVGKLIDAGLAAGANRVAGIEFALANAAPHREQALRQAVEKARREASAIADALGVPLGPVLDARTESPPVPPILRAESREMAVAAAVPTPIEPGALTVRATVTLRFRIGAAR